MQMEPAALIVKHALTEKSVARIHVEMDLLIILDQCSSLQLFQHVQELCAKIQILRMLPALVVHLGRHVPRLIGMNAEMGPLGQLATLFARELSALRPNSPMQAAVVARLPRLVPMESLPDFLAARTLWT